MKFLEEKNYTAVFSIPTGAGKTFFAIQALKKLLEINPGMRTLIIVPTNVLVKQWQEELRQNNLWLDKVGLYNGTCKEYSKIVITTVSSCTNVNYKIFDCLIVDECHKSGTPRMLELLSKDFKYKIGLSATPDREDMKHWEIYKHFSYNIFEYSIKNAIDDKVLNQFEFYNIVLKFDPETQKKYDEITQMIGMMMLTIGSYFVFLHLPNSDPRKQKLMGYIDMRKKLIWAYPKKLDIVVELVKKYKDEKIIVFSQYNSFTNSLFYYLGSEGIKSAVMHGNIKQNERDEGIEKFKNGEINVLATTKILDEGFNCPEASIGIITASEKVSRQVIQRLGRLLRVKKDNTPSILIQIYIKGTIEEEQAIEKTNFYKGLALKYEEINYD